MTSQPQPSPDRGRVGIYAPSAHLARVLAQDLDIARPICLGPRSQYPLRGVHLKSLLVHEDCWPLPHHVLNELRPSLVRHLADIYKVVRQDARTLLRPTRVIA